MAQLKYDKAQRMLWIRDGEEVFPIFTLANLNGNNTKLTTDGLLQVKNASTDVWETITDFEGNPISLLGLSGKDGDTPTVELSEEGMLTVSSKGHSLTINVIGPKGPKGDKGDTGERGLQGLKGDTGKLGPKGDKGDKGEKGDDGEKGEKGDTGLNGTPLYTWIKYADTADGSGMSDSPVSNTGVVKSYIGFAYNKLSSLESSDPSAYTWSLFKGEDGTLGIPGEKGADGTTYYTWIKYADKIPESGTDIYDEPKTTTEYIGIATNKTDQTESADPTQYNWSNFKGELGVPGQDMTYITKFPEDPAYGDRVFWNGPIIASNLVPNGYTELGEIYEYCNESTIPSDIMKLTIFIQYSTNPEFTDGASFSDSSLLAYNFMKLVQRQPRKYWNNNKQCIELDLGENYPGEGHALNAIGKILKEASDQAASSRGKKEWKTLHSTIQQVIVSHTSSMIYWKYYTSTTNLTENADYWVPVSELGRLETLSPA